ncbi:hypothetical protein K474DRAFT_1676421 [Panus rudis PR-1116 ss-1]|nr:hypothetical protein K474DRAFT_1676421 [Panus rudis PR-1116 ss-1]
MAHVQHNDSAVHLNGYSFGGKSDPTELSQLVVTNPAAMHLLLSEQALTSQRHIRQLFFYLPDDDELRRLGFTGSRAEVSEEYLSNVFMFLRRLKALHVDESHRFTLALGGFLGVKIPERVIAANGDDTWGLTFPEVHLMALDHCSFETMDDVTHFFLAFPFLSRCRLEFTRWPIVTDSRELFERGVMQRALPFTWAVNLDRVILRVSSLGDIWFLNQLNLLEPQKLKDLCVHWSDQMHQGFLRDILTRHVDLRLWPSLHTLYFHTVHETGPSAGTPVNPTPEAEKGSALTIASALIPSKPPNFAASHSHPLIETLQTDPYVNWLNNVVVDLRNLPTGPLSDPGSVLKTKEEFRTLLTQILTLKRINESFGEVNGVVKVIALVDGNIDPSFRGGDSKGNEEYKYRSVWDKELDFQLTRHGIEVLLKPVDV